MKIEIDKPVIPQFVADWIESNSSGFNIRGILEDINGWDTPDIINWCRKVDSELSYKTLVTAYLYGYEVEKEPLYYAKIKGWELINCEIDNVYWNLGDGDLYVSDNSHLDYCGYYTKLTKEDWGKVGINDTNADFEEME